MGLTRTRLELLTEIMGRGDLRAVRHPPAEVNRDIDQSIAKLWRRLVEANPDHALDSKDYTVISGTGEYPLENDFYKPHGVEVQDGSGWFPLPLFNWAERNKFQGATGKLSTGYRVMGSNLRLFPTPQWSGTVRLWYIPAATPLAGDDSTFDGICGWEEYVILDVIIKRKAKDRYDATDFISALVVLEAQIEGEAGNKNPADPPRIRDVETEAVPPWPI